MKIAILSDAHGNKMYFQKCCRAIEKQKPDRIIFLGDCFGYMQEGEFILSALRRMNAQILLGNHEAMLLGKIQYGADKEAVYRLKVDRENISDNNLSYLDSLQSSYYEEIDNKKILYVHGRPDNPLSGYLYADDKLYDWGENPYDYIFMGHTHYPYIKRAGTTIYVNAGSVGLPRDAGNAPCFVIFDTQVGKVTVHRVVIDREELETVIRQNIHPKVCECLMRKAGHICLELT